MGDYGRHSRRKDNPMTEGRNTPMNDERTNAQEIVKMLRAAQNYNAGVGTATIEDEAADLIESLTAENDRLEKSLKSVIAGQEVLQMTISFLQRRADKAEAEIVRIITNESRCDLCGRLLGNGDCEIYSDDEERCDPIPRYMRRGEAEGEKV